MYKILQEGKKNMKKQQTNQDQHQQPYVNHKKMIYSIQYIHRIMGLVYLPTLMFDLYGKRR